MNKQKSKRWAHRSIRQRRGSGRAVQSVRNLEATMQRSERQQRQHQDIKDVIEVEDQINADEWERDFLRSIYAWTERRELTVKQDRVFSRLYQKAKGLPEQRGKDRGQLKKKLDKALREAKTKARKKTPDELWGEAPAPHPDDGEVFL